MAGYVDGLQKAVADAPQLMRQKRKSLGLSIEAVAQKTGISSSTISRFEAGERKNPSAIGVAALCKCYGLSMDEVFAPRIKVKVARK